MRRSRTMKGLRWAVGVVLLSSGLLVMAPAAPAQATPRPVLLVGGHTNQQEAMEDWADWIDGKLGLGDDQVRGVELVSDPPDWPDWPGAGSNEASAEVIRAAIEDLHADHGTPVDVIGVSQGAVATRYLLQQNTANIRSKVAGFVSFSGANAGVPDNPWFGTCEATEFMAMCDEMVFELAPGDPDWLELNVNRWTYGGPLGDPTPGSIEYFHIYTTNDGEYLNNWPDWPYPFGEEWEALKPYGWSVPLLGATNRSAQQECGPTYLAPHGGWWLFGEPYPNPNPVMEELLIDALERRPLDARAQCSIA